MEEDEAESFGKLQGEAIGTRPLLALGFFLVIGGLQFLTTGVLAELLIRVYYDRGHTAAYQRRLEGRAAEEPGWHAPPEPAGEPTDRTAGA